MTIKEAISQANQFRPNTIEDEIKFKWLSDLDNEIRERMGLEQLENPFPSDMVLSVESPHDQFYSLYLQAQIDYYNQELTTYANDMTVYTLALNETLAWWRRNNIPTSKKARVYI